MIGILDYGIGNLSSIQNMLKKAGFNSKRIKSVDDLYTVDKIILPGVGAFDYGMEMLQASNFIPTLNELVLEKKMPTLGICLGMQLMCKSSDEGVLSGLNWVDAKVRSFDFQQQDHILKVPHMGWNEVSVVSENILLKKDIENLRYYFVHSYYVDCNNIEDIIITCQYGHEFVVGFRKDNIFGVQFHPEKSHRFGLELLKNFASY